MKTEILKILGLDHLENVDRVRMVMEGDAVIIEVAHRPNDDKFKGITQVVNSYELIKKPGHEDNDE